MEKMGGLGEKSRSGWCYPGDALMWLRFGLVFGLARLELLATCFTSTQRFGAPEQPSDQLDMLARNRQDGSGTGGRSAGSDARRWMDEEKHMTERSTETVCGARCRPIQGPSSATVSQPLGSNEPPSRRPAIRGKPVLYRVIQWISSMAHLVLSCGSTQTLDLPSYSYNKVYFIHQSLFRFSNFKSKVKGMLAQC